VPTKPLSEPVFWILLSLTAGPLHGYALMKDVHALSERRVRLTTGTLYGALARMLADEWIARADKALYKAKQNGRDRVAVAESLTVKIA